MKQTNITHALTPGQQYLKDRAQQAASHRLHTAVSFVNMHGGKPGFKKIMRLKKCDPVMVRWDEDGVLRCFDAVTADQLCSSLPGHIDQLDPHSVAKTY